MNSLGIADVQHEKVSIQVRDSEGGAIVNLGGVLDMEDPGVLLDPIWDKLHQIALEKKFETITLDVTQLSFLNSSGIKSLARWVLRLSQCPADQRYKVVIQQNPNITWQKTSLVTLTYAAPGVVTVL